MNPGPGAIPHGGEGSQKSRTGLTCELAEEKDENEASWGTRHIVLWMSVTKLNPLPSCTAHVSSITGFEEVEGVMRLTSENESCGKLMFRVFFFFLKETAKLLSRM